MLVSQSLLIFMFSILLFLKKYSPECRNGYKGLGPICWESCKEGERDDGTACWIDVHIYGNRCSGNCTKGYINDGCTCRRNAVVS